MSNASTLNLEALYPYILDVSLREHPLLASLREETALDEMSRMQIAPEQGQFMALLVKLTGAKKYLEIGTYTGYSALSVALALPDNGAVVCCDISEYWTNMARRYWEKAGMGQKITLHLAPAIETLDKLLADGEENSFDFVFIDADKENYEHYYERSLKLVRPGGLIMVDNVLWSGSVINNEINDVDTRAIRQFNKTLKSDERVDISLLPLADGITLARKRYA